MGTLGLYGNVLVLLRVCGFCAWRLCLEKLELLKAMHKGKVRQQVEHMWYFEKGLILAQWSLKFSQDWAVHWKLTLTCSMKTKSLTMWMINATSFCTNCIKMYICTHCSVILRVLLWSLICNLVEMHNCISYTQALVSSSSALSETSVWSGSELFL